VPGWVSDATVRWFGATADVAGVALVVALRLGWTSLGVRSSRAGVVAVGVVLFADTKQHVGELAQRVVRRTCER